MSSVPWAAVLAAAYLVWVTAACVSILSGRRSPTSTLAWIFAFVALPILSGVAYLAFGPHRLKRRKRRYLFVRGALAGEVSAYLRGSCREKPELPPHVRPLASVGDRLGQGGPRRSSAVALLDDGDACLLALESAISGARHHLHLEYYIWEPDGVGTRVRDALVEARRRGVEVRVLVDALGSPRAGAAFWAPLRAAGGEARSFNPLRLSPARVYLANFRTHRKIAVCDGTTGFLGGINLHEPESRRWSGDRAWRDAHLCVEGEPVRRLQRLFFEAWAYSGGTVPITAESVRHYFPAAAEVDGPLLQVLASGPDDESAPIRAFVLAALASARRRVWIETPYLVPDEALESALVVAHLRGVDVQVIVPRRGDSRLVTAASRTYCDALRRAGIAVHEYGPPMLHAKTLLVDDSVAVVGTANLDNRSFRLNFEVAAAVYDPHTVRELALRFEEDRAAARPFPAHRRGPRLEAFLESLARLTSPML